SVLEPVVELDTPAGSGPHALAKGLGQAVEPAGVPAQQPVQLDVEREGVRRRLDPAAHGPLSGDGVERRIDLHAVEVARVERQPLTRRKTLRIPLLDESWVRP